MFKFLTQGRTDHALSNVNHFKEEINKLILRYLDIFANINTS